MAELADRVAFVTGSGQAAGRAYARALAAAGAKVVVADVFEDTGRETVQIIEKDGGTATFVPVDVTDQTSVRTAIATALGQYGQLDILVNNPSRYRETSFHSIESLDVEYWDRTMAVMVRGTFLPIKAALPALEKSPHAVIVNHTSSAAYGVRNWLDYGTARGAVISMTKSLAKELAPRRIRVNALSVGSSAIEAMALGVIDNAGVMTTTADFKNQLISRLASDEDVAGPIVFLASDASQYMTGQTVEADGGKYLLG